MTFTPNPDGPRRVLLEKTTVSGSMAALMFVFVCCEYGLSEPIHNLQLQVKDPRFEWTRDKMLVLKEVTHSDQGLYAIKLYSGFTYETVHLVVSGTIVSTLCESIYVNPPSLLSITLSLSSSSFFRMHQVLLQELRGEL